MSNILAYITKVTQSPNFITFMAHFWFLFALVVSFYYMHHGSIAFVCVLTAIAAAKEFFYDLHYELNPPQTLMDSVKDFSGYFSGAWLATLFVNAYIVAGGIKG